MSIERLVLLCAGLIGCAVCAAILLPPTLPLHDWPNHVMRLEILMGWDASSVHHANYTVASLLLPNVAMDVGVMLLGTVLPVELACRVFLCLSLLACLGGTLALGRAWSGRLGLGPLLAGVLVLNGIVVWGFVNYLFGLGVMLWALAAWLRIGEPWRRIGLATGLSLLLYFSHLVAFGLYAIALLGIELAALAGRRRTLGGFLIGGIQFLPPLGLFIAGRDRDAASFEWGRYEGALAKVEFLVRSFATYHPGPDLLLGLVLVALAGLVLLGRARIRLAEGSWPSVLLLGLAFLALPFTALGSLFLDARVPLAWAFVAAAALVVTFRDSRAERRAVLALAGLALLRTGLLALAWQAQAPVYGSLGFAALRPGDILFTAEVATQGLRENIERWQAPLTFAASYAARQGAFVPGMFADPRHQPLVVSPAMAPLYAFQNQVPKRVLSYDDLLAFAARIRELAPDAPSYVFLIGCDRLRGFDRSRPGAGGLQPVGPTGGRTCLFQVRRPG